MTDDKLQAGRGNQRFCYQKIYNTNLTAVAETRCDRENYNDNLHNVIDHFTINVDLKSRTESYLGSPEHIVKFSYTGSYDWITLIANLSNHRTSSQVHMFQEDTLTSF